MTRFVHLVALCGVLTVGGLHLPAWAGEAAPVPAPTPSGFDAVGRLMPNEETRTSRRAAPYVLVDKDGAARCYVVSRAGADLSDFVDTRVGVRGSVRFVAGDPLPLILAGAVQPVGDAIARPPAASVATSPAPERPKQVAAEPVQRVAHARREHAPQEPTLAELPTPAPEAEPLLTLPPAEEVPSVDSFPEAMPGNLADFGPEPGEGPKLGCDCEACGGTSCTTCSECCLANDPGRWFVRAEYLAWATKGMAIPPLATTGPGASNPGILGQPGTVILFGNEAINGDMRSGGRISFGSWLNPEQTWGLSAEYFGLADAGDSFFAASNANGVPTISRPYFTVYGVQGNGTLKPAGQNAELVALENVLAGSLRVETNTSLQGGGVFLRRTFCCSNRCWKSCDENQANCTSCCDEASSGVPGGVRVGMFGGYRFMLLDDGVSITEDLTAIASSPAEQGKFLINDRFSSNNQFHGGELGFIAEARRARWTMELISRLALGNNYQTMQINGSTVISESQQDDGTYQGGLLALPTNIGSYSRNQFSVIPQLNANLGYNLTPRLRVILGYTFLYWGNVARAGEQISLDVNETYIPAGFAQPEGPRRPSFVWNPNDFWAQGLNLGLDYFW